VRTVRRVVSALVMCVLLGAGFLATGVATASASTPQVSMFCKDGNTVDCIQAPRSIVKGAQQVGEKFTTYCVQNYKGNSVVKVVNEKTGQVASIHTNGKGVGCVQMPVTANCQDLTAHGSALDGSPGSSSARVCVTEAGSVTTQQPTAGPAPVSSGGLPFTGSNVIIPGTILGLLLIAGGVFFVLIARRRGDEDDEDAPAAA
jgi:hypothetical protein